MLDDQRHRLWAAVDTITEPTHRRINRDTDAEWLDELANDPSVTFCIIADYRAATLAYGHVPPLWDQATWAVTGSEAGDGSGGRSPLRERTPADLDLMETLLTIRESMAWQLPGRGLTPRDGMKAQMRQLAAHVVTHEPQHVEWWAYRFEQWARLLRNHLNALDRAPRPVHLRNAACPLCKTRQVTLENPDTRDRTVVPAILIDFTGGWIRAAQCQACGHAWFRGSELGDLAQALADQDPGHAEAM